MPKTFQWLTYNQWRKIYGNIRSCGLPPPRCDFFFFVKGTSSSSTCFGTLSWSSTQCKSREISLIREVPYTPRDPFESCRKTCRSACLCCFLPI
jgi:hypothetical protein